MQVTRVFDFNNRAESLLSVTDKALSFLKARVPVIHHGSILFKSRFIITELLTNGIKHSGADQSQLKVIVHRNSIKIIRSDNGKALVLDIKPGEKLALHADDVHCLFATAGYDGTIRFTAEEMNTPEINVDNLSEHYGLLIIAKASGEFIYKQQGDMNLFSARILLG